jgi:hypothetical protein
MGRILVGFGLVLALAGLIVMGIERGMGSRGLPGDLAFRWGNFTVYLPLATSILISIVLTTVLFVVTSVMGRR